MRKAALIVIVALAAAILCLPLRKPDSHRMTLRTYFRNGDGLQLRAPVRVDGVELGSVISVRVRPELGERPIEVVMAIATSYDLAIPSDSNARLLTQGLLGPTAVDIDTRHAQGVRIGNNGVLTSLETPDETKEAIGQAEKAMNRLADQVDELNKKLPPPEKKGGTFTPPNAPPAK
jgi:ABC-type transporter Mla subunit MlaD